MQKRFINGLVYYHHEENWVDYLFTEEEIDRAKRRVKEGSLLKKKLSQGYDYKD